MKYKTNTEVRLENPSSNRRKGLLLFQKARRVILSRQMRADGDMQFQEELRMLRDTKSAQPVPDSLISHLKELSQEDIENDPSWLFATILVLSNYELYMLNRVQAYAFAKAYYLPLVKWKHTLTEKSLRAVVNQVGGNRVEDFFAHEGGLWNYFVRGAPAMMLENIQPTKLLVNGSLGHMYSLTLDPNTSDEITARVNGEAYDDVTLTEPPLSINFQFSVAEGESIVGIESLVEGAVVVPVCLSRGTDTFET